MTNAQDIKTFGFQWHITERCNSRCNHCYQEIFDQSREPGVDELKKLGDHILTTLAPVPVTVNLTGGEPLLVPRIFEFLHYLSTFNNLEELNLITNAQCIDDEMLQELKKVTRLRFIKVSLESHDPQINDSIRGKGHFGRLMPRLLSMRDAGFRVVLMVSLGIWNMDSVKGIIRLARKLEIEGVIFERFVPLGQGKKLAEGVLRHDHWATILGSVLDECEMENSISELLPYRAFQVGTGTVNDSDFPLLSGALCNLGPESMALMPDGTVFPCRRLPQKVGQLPDQSIREIIDRLREFSPQTLKLKMKGKNCGFCGYSECAGCRAVALALGLTLFDDDPQCPVGRSIDTFRK